MDLLPTKNRRAMVFLGLAALCGLATATTARTVLQASNKPEAVVPVVVASEALQMGQAAGQAPTSVLPYPRQLVPQGTFRSAAALQGRVFARTITPGEPILESALLPEGSEAGLDALIAESARAVSVKVDEFVGVAGFLQPGSRVDVLTTFKSAGSGTRSTRVVLQNVKVLAVDKRLVRNDGGAEEEIKVVTLQVSPKHAPTLAHAEHEGRIKLALRNQHDDDEIPPVQVVLGTDVQDLRF